MGSIYADTRSGYIYFGIPVTDDERVIECKSASSGSTSFNEFTFGGDYTFLTGYSECPRWKQTEFRANLIGTIIKITYKGKVYLTDVATAISRGPYIIEGMTGNYIKYILLM